ncbi:MAG: glycosyltransferase [Bacteroidia bacterium]|nr:glycosyltransferase [Bacteroidia bacterium]
MLFSIIIPTYNRVDFITKAMQSVINQQYSNWELIIIDDGSTDNTEQSVQLIKDKRIYYTKIKNAERGAARNKGMDLAKGDYITFLDSDDFLLPNYFDNAYQKLTAHQSPPFFHQGYTISTPESKVLQTINFLKSNNYTQLAQGNPLSCMGVFIRKDVADNYRFNEDRSLSGSEDWELWLRISANYGFISDNTITACLVDHTSRSVKYFNEQQLVLRKEIAITSAFKDIKVQEVYGKYYKVISANCDTYISLHLALSSQKIKAVKYLINALLTSPTSLLRKRTLAILKHLVVS